MARIWPRKCNKCNKKKKKGQFHASQTTHIRSLSTPVFCRACKDPDNVLASHEVFSNRYSAPRINAVQSHLYSQRSGCVWPQKCDACQVHRFPPAFDLEDLTTLICRVLNQSAMCKKCHRKHNGLMTQVRQATSRMNIACEIKLVAKATTRIRMGQWVAQGKANDVAAKALAHLGVTPLM